MTSTKDEIDSKLLFLFKESLKIKYNNSWTYDELMNNSAQLEIELNNKERQIEKYKYELLKCRQAVIEKDSELAEKRLLINNLKNQLKLEKEDKAAKLAQKTLSSSHNSAREQLGTRPDSASKTHLDLNNRRSNEIQKDDKEMSYNYDDISFEDGDNSIIRSIKRKYLRKNTKGCLKDDLSKEKQDELTQSLIKLSSAYTEIKERYNEAVSELNDKIKINNALRSEVDFWKKNKANSQEFNENIQNAMTISLMEGLKFIKEELGEFLQSWNIVVDLKVISLSKNYEEKDQRLIMMMKEIKYLVVNLKRLKLQFKTILRDVQNSIQRGEDKIVSALHQKLDFLNNKLMNTEKKFKFMKI